MKHVLLIGANGDTARQLIPRLLELDDIKLTLFLRHAERMQQLQSDRVTLRSGDANNIGDLRDAVAGKNIVISTMGGLDLDTKTANIIAAMKEADVRRLIVISAGGIYDELPTKFNTWDKSMVGEYRPINFRTAELVEQSGLVYTVLRPVWLTDSFSEEYELTEKGETYKGTETSRASVARFIANVVREPSLYSNANLGISQPNTEGNKPLAYR
ncbi:SDR family oxidoreductase [Xanthomonas citri]|uniref:SDR family oxidoreductase n=1 Tax=Xanthomonas citri TaxID=346 RepID=UPI00188577F0|nr:SDR family oxidoreductase [Xanthomonas citri]QOY21866.1 SDR family oxidoreductase [Xanthomonas citri]QQK68008.1 SDR family oxidoreductase [Xanthomonas citri]